MLTIPMIKNFIAEIADKYELTKVELFGSYAKGKATEDSDLDLLVEFTTPAVSLIRIISLKYELEDRFQMKVDVVHGPVSMDSLLIIDKVVTIYERQLAGERNDR